MSFPIKLIGELVAVRLDPVEGPIRLPDWKRVLTGEIIATGPGCTTVQPMLRASFGAAVGMDAQFAGSSIRILKESDLDFVYDSCTCSSALDPETNIEYHGKGCRFSEA